MVNARLHTICGNCGCNDNFKLKLSEEDHPEYVGGRECAVYLYCKNCATVHDVTDNAGEYEFKRLKKDKKDKIIERLEGELATLEANALKRIEQLQDELNILKGGTI